MARIIKSNEQIGQDSAVVYKNALGEYHREDGPAVEFTNGTKMWYIRGELHRTDGPAKIFKDGTKQWFFAGRLHREDGPASEGRLGNKEWFLNGLKYSKEWADGTRKWWQDGGECKILHREDGPAWIKPDGTELWLIKNQLHRTDGPAVVYPDGEVEYWVEGKEFSKEDFEAKYMPKAVEEKDESICADRNKQPQMEISPNGTKVYRLNGVVHREDGPAIIHPHGSKEWWHHGVMIRKEFATNNGITSNTTYSTTYKDKDGHLHREDGPAVLGDAQNCFEYYKHGFIHREDGPARAGWDGQLEWFVDGKRHRLDGPAFISPDGEQHWFKENRRHRLDGPAIECSDGRREWFVDGNRHRLDGPAAEYVTGEKMWYINGENLAEKEFNKKREKQLADQQFEEIKSRLILDSDGQWTLAPQIKSVSAEQPPIKEILNDQGLRHCEDGPAVVYADGRQEWWLNGEKIEKNTPLWKELLKASIAVTFSACLGIMTASPEKQEAESKESEIEAFEVPTKITECVDA